MNRHFLMLRLTVKDGERAFLMRNGRFEQVLGPGRHQMFDPTKADEVAIVSLDGRPTHLMSPWQTRVFWKVATRVEVERIDVASDPKVKPRHLAMVARERNTLVAEHVVENPVQAVSQAIASDASRGQSIARSAHKTATS